MQNQTRRLPLFVALAAFVLYACTLYATGPRVRSGACRWRRSVSRLCRSGRRQTSASAGAVGDEH